LRKTPETNKAASKAESKTIADQPNNDQPALVRNSSRPKQAWKAALIAVGAAAFAAEIPFFFFGTPSGHDVEFHLYSWVEVLAQWKQGIVFPRWAAMAHFAYGEPRFIFYPPASWLLGALLSAVFPWGIASSVYIWIVLTLAGMSMFVLARRWFDPRDAIFAAVLYAVNPYHLVIVYWRSAFAELLASCLLPLLLWLVLKAVDGERRVILPLSLVMAAAWLTNAPAAVMIHYSFALLLVVFAWQKRSARPLLVGAAAVAIGACLAAFYLLPAIYEQKWVNIAEAISQGSRPIDNFLFIHTTDADHDAFNRVISWVAILEIAVTLVMAWGARKWAARKWLAAKNHAWNALFLWAVICSVLMFPFTTLLWRFLPKLQFMQFPWRWMLCLSMVFTIFVAAGARRWWGRIAVYVIALVVIVTLWLRVLPPWWDNAGDLKEMRDNMTDGIGYEGVDEYTPVGADPAAIDKDARKVTVDGDMHSSDISGSDMHSSIHVLLWNAESKRFTAEMSAPGQLVLRLFRYPAWRVEVNGRAVETSEKPGTGQMLIPVGAGMNRVQITFARTWDRTAGGWISVATAILLILWRLRLAPERRSSPEEVW
jgi:hypothetical protein